MIKEPTETGVEKHGRAKPYFTDTFFYIFTAIQILHLALFGVFTEYDFAPQEVTNTGLDGRMSTYYFFFTDVSLMLFIGFGFLMTFVRRYSFSAVGLNFAVSVLCIQWALLVLGFFELAALDDPFAHKIRLSVRMMIDADFSAAAGLITMGALLGKASPTQLLLVTWLEMLFYGLNFWINIHYLQVVDVGGSFGIHAFGAFFGLAASYGFGGAPIRSHPDQISRYTSDIFAMIGTLFLWLYWPSFNSALANPLTQHRAAMNTFLALLVSAFVAFLCSRFFRGHRKFDMVDIQNATIAGGVAIGSTADQITTPLGAMSIGCIAAIISVAGYVWLQPFLLRKAHLHDTCGVLNLHGLPGLFGGLASVVVTALGARDKFTYEIPVTTLLPKGSAQWAFQFAGIGVTLGISIIGGLIVGQLVGRCHKTLTHYSDAEYWEVPLDFPDTQIPANSSVINMEEISSVEHPANTITAEDEPKVEARPE